MPGAAFDYKAFVHPYGDGSAQKEAQLPPVIPTERFAEMVCGA